MPGGNFLYFLEDVLSTWLSIRRRYGTRTANNVVGVLLFMTTIMVFPRASATIGILMVGGAAYAINTRQQPRRAVEQPHSRSVEPPDSNGFSGFSSQHDDDLPPMPYRKTPKNKSSTSRSSHKGGHGGGDTDILRKIEPGEVIPAKGVFISESYIDDVITKVLMRYGISSDDIKKLLELADSHNNDFDSLQKDDAYNTLILEISKKLKKTKQSNNKTRRSNDLQS
jgi:hypothetical protein